MENIVEETYMDLNVAFLRVIGIWPKRPLFGRVSGLLASVLAMYAFFFYGFAREIYMNMDSFINVTEALGIGFLCTITFIKLMTIVLNEKKLLQLIYILKHNFYMYEQRENEEHRTILENYEKQSKFLTILFFLICMFTASSFTALPLVEGLFFRKEDNVTDEYVWKFPYKIAYPIDTTDSVTYVLIYLYHGYVGITHVFLIPACDNFVVALMSHACGQLQILQNTLENLRDYAMKKTEKNLGLKLSRSSLNLNFDYRKRLETEFDSVYDSEHEHTSPPEQQMKNYTVPYAHEVEKGMEKRLKDLARHHQRILQFICSLEDIFNGMMLAQFFGSTIMYCTAAFHMTLSGTAEQSVKLISMAGLVCGALLQLGMYCFFADQVKEESEAVGIAAYSAEWYLAHKSVQSSLKIIMMRSQKTPTLTIGKFVELSLDTYAEILKGSYTYFAMLSELND